MGWKEVKRMKKVQIDPATQRRPTSRKQNRSARIKEQLTQQVEVQVIPAKADMEGYERPKPRVCAYCRVSTDMDTQALSYELQVQNYTEYITSNPDWEFAGIYADRGISGTSLRHRDNFNRMIADCEAGKIDLMFDDQSEIVEDEPPTVAPQEQPPITQPGDRWLLGNHVLYCGDSTKAEDVAALMAGAVADLCITDPPYNVAYEGSNGKTIQNDDMPEDQFVAFLTAAFQRMHDVLKPGAPFYIWHAETEGGAFRRSCTAALGKVRQMLIWNKNSFTMGHQDYQWKHEACIYGCTVLRFPFGERCGSLAVICCPGCLKRTPT